MTCWTLDIRVHADVGWHLHDHNVAQGDHLQPDAGGVLVIVEDLVHRRVLRLKTSHQALQHVL